MNIFCVIIPKRPLAAAMVIDQLNMVAEQYKPRLGPAFHPKFKCIELKAGSPVYCLTFSRHIGRGKAAWSRDRRHYVISSGNVPSSQIADQVSIRSGKFLLDALPGGIYSAVAIDMHLPKVRAWSSQPSQDGLFIAESDDWTVLSNRPLLCAMMVGRDVTLSEEYLRRYISLSYTPDDVSPFDGVQAVLPEEMITVFHGKPYRGELPYPPPPDLSQATLDEKVTLGCDILMAACEQIPLFPGRGAFHLSGGKDSRLLLAAFHAMGTPVDALTYGRPTGDECRIAQAVVAATDIPHTIAKRRAGDGSLFDAAAATIRRCDGLPPSAADQVVYAKDDHVHSTVNAATILGHIQLQRGGWAMNMTLSPDRVAAKIDKQLSPFSNPEAGQFFRDRIAQLESRRSCQSHLEKLYWHNFDLRAGRWLASQWIDTSNRSVPVYPMVDERFAQFCSAISVPDRVTEIVAFKMIERMCPALLKVPLHRDNWKFEAHARHPEHSGEFYDLRKMDPDLNPYVPKPPVSADDEFQDILNPNSPDAIRRIGEPVKDYLSSNAVFQETVSDQTKSAVFAIGSGSKGQYAEAARQITPHVKSFEKFVWRLFSAAVWADGKWVT